jgi:hypothetical protein
MSGEKETLRGSLTDPVFREQLCAAIDGNRAYLVGFDPSLDMFEATFDGLKLLLGVGVYYDYMLRPSQDKEFKSN